MRSLGPQREDDDVAETRRLILASASPRRAALLRGAGQRFDIEPSQLDEERAADEDALGFVERMAFEKGDQVAVRRPGRWILAADTVVIVEGEVFGKPSGRAEACEMLRRLSGRGHEVATAFALFAPDRRLFERRVVRTEVFFRPLSEDEIAAYVAIGDPLDKAGAYAIQAGAAPFVRELRGSRSNVVGLPMEEVEAALRKAGLWADATGE
ncbi:MAG: Maf family protein [Candidatus Binatia bacterium]